MPADNDHGWIKPDAEIVVAYHYSNQPVRVRIAKVTRVTATTFTVEGVDKRFNLERLTTSRSDGWVNSYYQAHRPGTAATNALIKHANRVTRREQAETAVSRWQRNRNRENRLAAIAALQKVED